MTTVNDGRWREGGRTTVNDADGGGGRTTVEGVGGVERHERNILWKGYYMEGYGDNLEQE